MGRTERVMQLLERLRAGDATTVGALARELGVSPRTVLRDLATLRAAGSAILGEAGPAGGVRLARDYGSTTVHFALAEIVGLWLAATLSRELSEVPWGDAATRALGKLLQNLPAAKARDLRMLSARIILAPPASLPMRRQTRTAPPELLRVFEEAFSRGNALSFHYVDRRGTRTRRTIEPHGLLVKPPRWYILSRDVEKSAPRAFRMDRISHPRIVRTITFRPQMDVVRAQVPPDRGWRSLLSDGCARI
jgi:predicted DNA-binding transcriptional regulator YafY